MTNIVLRDYQDTAVVDIRAAFRRHEDPVLFQLATGGGKCLGRGTPILMFDGTRKPVEEVDVDDLLMGPNCRPRRVLSLARGREMLYRVVPDKGDPYVVNESHILSLRHEQLEFVWNISVRDYLKLGDEKHRYRGWRVPGVLNLDMTPERCHIEVFPMKVGDYFGFEIDGDHLFMLGDFTVTHNTYTFCYIALHAAKKGNTVFIIVHRDELLRQASKALHNLGIQHGMISPKFTPDPYQRIQVCSVDTLLNRLKKRPGKYQPDLAVFDEGHHVTKKNKWGKAYTLLGEPRTLLVTATPSRGDGIGMGVEWGGICKSLIKGPPVSLLIERGMLIEPIVYAGKIIPDFSKLKTNKDGEYNENELAALTDKKEITGNSVEHYTAICPGVRAVVFCANIVHAKHVAEEFCAAGYKFKLLVGKPEMSDTERGQVVREISTGAIQGICVVDLVSEGFDVPALKCCIMLRHVGHITQFLQMIGRVMRPDGTDTQAYCLDHVGNVGVIVDNVFVPKHGLPSQDREWTLEGRAKGKKKAPKETDIKLKQCKHCYFVFQLEPECPTCIETPHHTHTPNEPHCPSCGEALPAQKTRKEAEEKDGTLGQVTPDMARIQQMRRRREIAQARTLEELEAYAAAHGYSKGWAWHTYNARKKKVS